VWRTRQLARGMGFVIGAAVMLAACSSSPQLSATTSSTTHLQTSTTIRPTTTSSTVVPSTTTTFVAMQPPTGGEFQSPTGNISCQVTDTTTNTSAYCVTGTPPEHVTMTADGSITTCSGPNCLSNAGLGTPVLGYGSVTGVGPFRCLSAISGVACTVTSGKGFEISKAGIKPVG
jgi:hypothetical protein